MTLNQILKRVAGVTLLALCIPGAFCRKPLDSKSSIREALEYQVSHYPASQYRDVYKNFMQDYYGPGHILADTAAASAYIRREMAETEFFDGPLYEPTGFNGNFYRVNLKLIKDGVVPYDIFFNAFVESVKGIIPPEPEEWMRIWGEIDGEIKRSGLHFVNEDTDRESMAKQFDEGNFVVHHSDAYNNAVNFHYRIISRDNFNNVIMPYIRAKQQ